MVGGRQENKRKEKRRMKNEDGGREEREKEKGWIVEEKQVEETLAWETRRTRGLVGSEGPEDLRTEGTCEWWGSIPCLWSLRIKSWGCLSRRPCLWSLSMKSVEAGSLRKSRRRGSAHAQRLEWNDDSNFWGYPTLVKSTVQSQSVESTEESRQGDSTHVSSLQ